jgi:DNA transformation protein and related proteins
LAHLPNLGPKSAQYMQRAGITSFEQLKCLGSVAAYSMVKQVEPSASLNLLWALEGAISGLHWQEVAKEHRTSLLLALETYEKRKEAGLVHSSSPSQSQLAGTLRPNPSIERTVSSGLRPPTTAAHVKR